MQKSFEYCYTTQAIGDINIEDIGNCCIEAMSDMGETYYFLSRTNNGFTILFQYGPFVKDSDILEKSVSCTFKRIEYKESQIITAINKFLNNPYANITQAYEVDDYKEALKNCIDIVEYVCKEHVF